ncbi:hypothetical protein GEMRC1_003918 [Eukaryota sp. GEM-RC1]
MNHIRSQSLRQLILLYPKIVLKALVVALPIVLYVAFTLLSRVSLFCVPSERTMNDRFWLALENCIQNVLVLTFFYWPIYFLFPHKAKNFRRYAYLFGTFIGIYSVLKPFTLGDRVPAAYLLVLLYLAEVFYLVAMAKFCKKEELIKPRYFTALFVPFILTLLLMEFVIIRFYFASERYSTRLLLRIVVAPFMTYTSETFARLSIRRICSNWQDREADKQSVAASMKSMRKPFSLLFSIHSVVKLLVLRLLVANAGSFAETTFMILFSTFFEVIWKTTTRARDDFFERVFITSKATDQKRGSSTALETLRKCPSKLNNVSLNFGSEPSTPVIAQVNELVIGTVSPPNEVVSDSESDHSNKSSTDEGGQER